MLLVTLGHWLMLGHQHTTLCYCRLSCGLVVHCSVVKSWTFKHHFGIVCGLCMRFVLLHFILNPMSYLVSWLVLKSTLPTYLSFYKPWQLDFYNLRICTMLFMPTKSDRNNVTASCIWQYCASNACMLTYGTIGCTWLFIISMIWPSLLSWLRINNQIITSSIIWLPQNHFYISAEVQFKWDVIVKMFPCMGTVPASYKQSCFTQLNTPIVL